VAAALCLAAGATPVFLATSTAPAGASSPLTTYTPAAIGATGGPSVASITDGTSAAPWNSSQGDPGSPAYTSQAPGTLLPTYTPGGATTGSGVTAEPNLAVYPASGSGTDGVSPYPSGTVGTPGPLDGYCGTGNQSTEAAGTPATQPAGSTLPFAPAYFPHVVRNSDGSLTGYFDYRPKDADEAIVAATSTDNGRDWTYRGEALEQNPGDCPSADTNDDGQGHPFVMTVGGRTYLYTLERAAGDNAGVGLLVHQLTPTATNPLAGAPAVEKTGVDPDGFAAAGLTLGGSAQSIPLSQPIGSGPEQLVAGPFVDLTATPTPNASDVITCTSASGSTLGGCTSTTPITVGSGDLIEQVLATVSSGLAAAAPTTACSSGSTTPTTSGSGTLPCAMPSGPNATTGDAGLAGYSVTVTNANNLNMAIFNANAPNRAYVDGTTVYCAQANALPTNKIENCTTPGAAFAVNTGDPITSDPIVPSGAQQTTGLTAPDGIVGVLPSYPGAPAGSTVVLYTEKILNYDIFGYTGGKQNFPGTHAATITFTGFPNSAAASLPASGTFTVTAGDSTTNNTLVTLTCTGHTGTSITGCTGGNSSDQLAKNSYLAVSAACAVPQSTLGQTGEGSTKGSAGQKLLGNNEDLTVLQAAYTFDGVNFDPVSSGGSSVLANNGVISGASGGASSYQDISNPNLTASPSNLNAYAGAGTTDATELRFVGSGGSIITNPDGSYGLFLSGAWCGDGDSDAFNQIFYSSSTDGEHWTEPTSVISTDYTFSASAAQSGTQNPLGVSAYYSGRAYGPSVVQNPDGTLTMIFAGYRLPKPIVSAGTHLGTNGSALYTVGSTDPALYRNIMAVTLASSTSPAVGTQVAVAAAPADPVVGQTVTYTATVSVPTGAGNPSGTVSFTDAGGTLCSSATLSETSPDTASCTTTYDSPQSDTVTASYGGDANYGASSGQATVTVGPDPTTTSVAADPADPVVGQPVTYTATVASGGPGSQTPGGSVSFHDGADLCDTVALSGGVPDTASCTTTYTSPQSDTVTASYAGDADDAASSGQTSVTVGQDATTTAVSVGSPVVGQPVALSATVAVSAPGAGVPSGSVSFSDSSGTLCQATLNGAAPDTASCDASFGSAGADTVTATYAGDADDTGSSGTATISVGQAATTTSIGTDVEPAVTGQSVTYTATVGVVAPGSGTPGGAVTFFEGDGLGDVCDSVPVNDGTATCTVTEDHAGTAPVTADYSGDADFASSSSATLNEMVNPDGTATALAASPSDPVTGQSVTLTATVTADSPGGGTPGGTVDFQDNATDLPGCGAVTLGADGTATCTVSGGFLGGDPSALSASYSGSDDYAGSSDSLDLAVSAAGTSTSLSADPPGSLVAGEPVTLTATIGVDSPGSTGAGGPTGSVGFEADGTPVPGCGAAPVSGGAASCTVSGGFSAGSHSVTATYGGDAAFSGSAAGPLDLAVTPDATATTVQSSADPSAVGQPVTFTATVTPDSPGGGVPGGTVTFALSDPAPTRGAGSHPALSCQGGDTVALSGGAATCAVGGLALNQSPATVTATYNGDGNDQGSASGTVSQTVVPGTTSVTLTPSPSPDPYGKAVTVSAQVAPTGGAVGSPTGTVTFSVTGSGGTTASCTGSDTVTVARTTGKALCRLAAGALNVPDGPYTVAATYSGDANFSGSSTSVQEAVAIRATSTVLTAPSGTQTPGQGFTVTATVHTSPATPAAGGTVTFTLTSHSGPAPVCTGGDTQSLSSDTASCALPFGLTAPGSPYTVTATYNGDGNDQASTSRTATIRVG
jgi:hypothetical protein